VLLTEVGDGGTFSFFYHLILLALQPSVIFEDIFSWDAQYVLIFDHFGKSYADCEIW